MSNNYEEKINNLKNVKMIGFATEYYDIIQDEKTEDITCLFLQDEYTKICLMYHNLLLVPDHMDITDDSITLFTIDGLQILFDLSTSFIELKQTFVEDYEKDVKMVTVELLEYQIPQYLLTDNSGIIKEESFPIYEMSIIHKNIQQLETPVYMVEIEAYMSPSNITKTKIFSILCDDLHRVINQSEHLIYQLQNSTRFNNIANSDLVIINDEENGAYPCLIQFEDEHVLYTSLETKMVEYKSNFQNIITTTSDKEIFMSRDDIFIDLTEDTEHPIFTNNDGINEQDLEYIFQCFEQYKHDTEVMENILLFCDMDSVIHSYYEDEKDSPKEKLNKLLTEITIIPGEEMNSLYSFLVSEEFIQNLYATTDIYVKGTDGELTIYPFSFVEPSFLLNMIL